jgi:hypothetical protein
LVCILAPVSLVAVHIHRSPTFSIEDEEAHYDYVQRVAEGSIPRLGQQLLPSTNQEVRCVGRPPEAFTLPPCHGESRAELDSFYHSVNNAQYEAQQPPLYYAVTAVLRWPFIHILGIHRLPGTRITGAIWLAAGLLFMWLAAVILGFSWELAAAAALFVAAAPNVLLASSIVNDDAAAVLAGGLVAALGAAAWRMPNRLPWWMFALGGFVVVALKTTFLLPVIPVAGLLAIATWSTRARSEGLISALWTSLRRWLPQGGALLLGGLAAAVIWSIIFRQLALVNLKTFVPLQLAGSLQTSIGGLMGNAVAMFSPFTGSPAPNFQWTITGAVPSTIWSSSLESLDGELIEMLVIAAGLSCLFVKERRWPHWLGGASLLTLFFGGWAVGIGFMLTYNYNTPLPGRYGISVAVLMILALIGALRGRWAQLLFLMFSLVSFGLAFVFMLA